MCSKDIEKKLSAINSCCSIIAFSGENVVDFLNNLIISDITKFTSKKLYYSALCNPKGRIISSFFIYQYDNENLIIICPKNMQKDLTTFFNLRKFRLKFTISNPDFTALALPIEITDSSKEFINILTTKTTENFYLALFNANLVWIDQPYTEKHIPQHLNFDQHADIMSFSKGCYPGQEIIARIKYLGKVKKRMKLHEINEKEKQELSITNQNNLSPLIQLKNKNYLFQQICRTK